MNESRNLTNKFLNPLLPIVVGISLLASAAPAMAHHAFAAEFDADKPIDLSGTVTKARWINPHSWLYFDVKGPDGTVTNWGVEFGAPNALADAGLTRQDVAPGQHVRIQGYRSKNGGPSGYSVSVTLDDGRVIKTGGAADTPTAAASPTSATGASR